MIRPTLRLAIVMVGFLLIASGGLPAMHAQAQAPAEVVAYHAGSLNGVMNNDIGPGFTAATGLPFKNTGAPCKPASPTPPPGPSWARSSPA